MKLSSARFEAGGTAVGWMGAVGAADSASGVTVGLGVGAGGADESLEQALSKRAERNTRDNDFMASTLHTRRGMPSLLW